MSDTYDFVPSVGSGNVRYTLTDSELIQETAPDSAPGLAVLFRSPFRRPFVERNGRQETIDLRDIVTVRLVRVQGQWGCGLRTRDGRTFGFGSHYLNGWGDFEDRSTAYKAFVTTLHRRLQDSGADPKLIAGSSKGNYILGLMLIATGVALILLTPFIAGVILTQVNLDFHKKTVKMRNYGKE